MVVFKYDIKLILDYINGNDIDYDIDYLENDSIFMKQVINYTNDKNMYRFCSDELKQNYDFIKFLVLKFNKDLDFISSLANSYLKKANEDDINSKELIILISNLLGNKYNEKYFDFKVKATGIYLDEITIIQLCLNQLDVELYKQECGMGFLILLERFASSKIITDFFAEKLVKDIFYENSNYNIEQIVHSQIKNKSVLEKQGINSFIINYINKYDSFLASYISANINLIANVKKDIEKIIKNWSCYMDRLNQRRLYIVYQELNDYLVDNHIGLDVDEIIDYVLIKLNDPVLYEIFYEEEIDEEFYQRMEFKKMFLIDDSKLNLAELNCLKQAVKAITELFDKDVIEKESNNYQSKITKLFDKDAIEKGTSSDKPKKAKILRLK